MLPVKPDELKMNVGDAVKENNMKSIECNVSSSNPASSVGMEFLIDRKKKYIINFKKQMVLNITCKQCFLDNDPELNFNVNNW